MKIIPSIFVVLVWILSVTPNTLADSTDSREYQIKAAFLYNFINFVEWPKEKLADGNEPIIIGIIGKDPFDNAFEPIKNKMVQGKKVIIKRFKEIEELEKSGQKNESEINQEIEAIRKCHLLFICPSENEKLSEIIDLVKGHSVLTVADTEGFLEAGGIINFLIEEKKVRFEINVAAAKRDKLIVRSQLLRLAKRVIEEEPMKEKKS